MVDRVVTIDRGAISATGWPLRRQADVLLAAAIACALGICPAAALAEPSPTVAALSSVLVPGLGQAVQGDYGVPRRTSASSRCRWRPRTTTSTSRISSTTTSATTTLTARPSTRRRCAAISRCASPPTPRSTPPSAPTATRASATMPPTARRRRRKPSPTSRSRRSGGNTCRARRPSSRSACRRWRCSRSKGGYGIYRGPDVSKRDLHIYNVTANEFTAVGEEGFFRGFLNNELSNRWGDGWGLTAFVPPLRRRAYRPGRHRQRPRSLARRRLPRLGAPAQRLPDRRGRGHPLLDQRHRRHRGDPPRRQRAARESQDPL